MKTKQYCILEILDLDCMAVTIYTYPYTPNGLKEAKQFFIDKAMCYEMISSEEEVVFSNKTINSVDSGIAKVSNNFADYQFILMVSN